MSPAQPPDNNPATVAGYQRQGKGGQVIQVKPYQQNRDAGGSAALKVPGRPAISATPGQFPLGRSIPGLPAVSQVKPSPQAQAALDKGKAATDKVVLKHREGQQREIDKQQRAIERQKLAAKKKAEKAKADEQAKFLKTVSPDNAHLPRKQILGS